MGELPHDELVPGTVPAASLPRRSEVPDTGADQPAHREEPAEIWHSKTVGRAILCCCCQPPPTASVGQMEQGPPDDEALEQFAELLDAAVGVWAQYEAKLMELPSSIGTLGAAEKGWGRGGEGAFSLMVGRAEVGSIGRTYSQYGFRC